jgi:hypothetical protein
MKSHYYVKRSSSIPLKRHSLFFNTIPAHIDALVQSWHEFKNSVAVEIGLLTQTLRAREPYLMTSDRVPLFAIIGLQYSDRYLVDKGPLNPVLSQINPVHAQFPYSYSPLFNGCRVPFPWALSGRSGKLIINFHLLSRQKMRGALSTLPLTSSRPGALLTLQIPVVTVCATCFNILKHCILPTECFCVFRMVLK